MGMQQNSSRVRANGTQGGGLILKGIGARKLISGRSFGWWFARQVAGVALGVALLTPPLCQAQLSDPDGTAGPGLPVQPGVIDLSQTNLPVTAEVIAARAAAAAQLAASTNAALGPGGSSGSGPQVISASPGKPVAPPAQWVLGANGQFSASNALFAASLAAWLNTTGCLSVTVPGGAPSTPLRGTLLALAYYEPGPDGRSAIIG